MIAFSFFFLFFGGGRGGRGGGGLVRMSLKGGKLENQFSLYLVSIDWIPAPANNSNPLLMSQKSSQS